MRAPLFPEGTTATFTDYFKLNVDIEDVLAEFGYTFSVESSKLPRATLDNGRPAAVKKHLEEVIPHVRLANETARREFLIAPVLTAVALLTDGTIRVEYPLEVDDRLRGTLDYFLRARHHLLVVEAKNADLERGFTQLAVELVALDRWAEDVPDPRLYGAVSVGNIWQFGFLDRSEKRVYQDLNTYSVPTDLEDVMQILVAMLTE